MQKKLGLYIHIPFCKQKCNYCDFYSLGCKEKDIPMYIDALCKHIEQDAPLYKDYEIDTVFLGGGTPSLISRADFERLANTIKKELKITQGAEFSVEANPGTLDKEKLMCYIKNGVNRLSLGMQSTNDAELKTLGRIHTFDDFKKCYLLARECGFENINIDVMYGLPSQSLDDFAKTIEDVCEFNPEHISAYCLKIEENTPFYKMRSSLILPNDDEEFEMYIHLCSVLEKNGYEQYEISNFSKKGSRCVHNLKYWQSKEYIGVGPSAHSFFNGRRYCYKNDVKAYMQAVLNASSAPEKICEDGTALSENSMDEYVMLRLRLCDGVDEKEFLSVFNASFIDEYPRTLDYIRDGYIRHQNGAYSFTPKGFFVSNYILSQVLKFD